jgi:hypothetical protein
MNRTEMYEALKMWPTPQARDHFPPHKPEYIAAKRSQGHGMRNLNDVVAHPHMWATPTVKGDYNRAGLSSQSGDGLATQVGGALNPTWVEWLMGFPAEWTALDASVMPSSRRSRKLSGAQS